MGRPEPITDPGRPGVARLAAERLVRIVGFLVCVEIASGILQGYYTPIWTDIAGHLGMSDADVNWFEAAQLIVATLVVPPLARLGDMVGHKRVLVASTAVTALGSWVLVLAPNFATFLIGFAVQGAYIVWLPIEIAIVYRRTAGRPRQGTLTRYAAAVLVGALELAVIIGALTSGALVESVSMPVILALPATAVTLVLVLVIAGIEHVPGAGLSNPDLPGLGLLIVALGLVMAGLIVIRLQGLASVPAWVLLALGIGVLAAFVRFEAARERPFIDVRLLALPGQWPVQLTAFLFGMSVLGAQIPLSTFARTDPAVAGYGLGAGASFVSTLIGVYVISLAAGAFTFPVVARVLGTRRAHVLYCLLVAAGYALWLPFHATTQQALTNMVIAGLGSGALVAALPVAAAAGAPPAATGLATGMTNATKTVGGAIASSIFAIALSATGSIDDPAAGHASLSGYLTVWSVCAVAALLAALALARLPVDRGEVVEPAG
ncbi:MFS transporter [Dactylosporangium matsuzakiense]|uniref:MFS transporter n=1 Tax=Dactylosporangium matsuzakiense TaxID=53360 RepID=A0A9W6KPE2_9ACTN|nr:MFS transporter [Dactylosporangium matsuzakiense]UWZ48696.1 MFS transporter [Dactylosporangium matsuzakiense]GLL03069.1 MFS transporter [Dactylosporangium matsuzakiense]